MLILPYTERKFKKFFRKEHQKMRKILASVFLMVLSILCYSSNLQTENFSAEKIFMENIPLEKQETTISESRYLFLYNNFQLSDKISYRVFKLAFKGYSKIENKKGNYLVIIDYSKPSNEKRFAVLNMGTLKLEDYTYVAHGKNTGTDMAISFSNKVNSYKSSLGFYLTGKTYNGRYGYSLKLYGLEEGFNSNAYTRGVVIHGADASEPEYLKKYGFLGRTEGCPAVPKTLNKGIVEKLRNGSVVFVYGNDENYLRESKLIK